MPRGTDNPSILGGGNNSPTNRTQATECNCEFNIFGDLMLVTMPMTICSSFPMARQSRYYLLPTSVCTPGELPLPPSPAHQYSFQYASLNRARRSSSIHASCILHIAINAQGLSKLFDQVSVSVFVSVPVSASGSLSVF